MTTDSLLMEMKLAPSWGYRPVAPFYVQIMFEHPLSGTVAEYPTIEAASFQMLRHALPWQPGATAFVLDGDGVAMSGYIAMEQTLRDFLGEPGWYGCAAGIEVLERLGVLEPVNLAYWESTARRAIEGDDW